jgi:hypothetical protein
MTNGVYGCGLLSWYGLGWAFYVFFDHIVFCFLLYVSDSVMSIIVGMLIFFSARFLFLPLFLFLCYYYHLPFLLLLFFFFKLLCTCLPFFSI